MRESDTIMVCWGREAYAESRRAFVQQKLLKKTSENYKRGTVGKRRSSASGTVKQRWAAKAMSGTQEALKDGWGNRCAMV